MLNSFVYFDILPSTRRRNVQLRFSSITALLTTLWLITPVKAETPCSGKHKQLQQINSPPSPDLSVRNNKPLLSQNNANLSPPAYLQKPPWEQGVGKHRKIVPYLPDKFSSQVKQAIDSVIDLTKIPNSSRPDGSQITPPPLSAPELLWSQLLPPPEELLEPPATPEVPSPSIQETITVDKFEFTGNTAFSEQELATVTEPFTNRPITFAELLSARTAVTKLYTDNGYLTSGAFIPPQSLDGGSVTIAILEGGLDEIEVNGTKRLNSGYVRSRLEIATGKPLNVQHLLDALRLLQLDPLIENLSAELSTGSGPGTSLLTVTLTEANSWSSQIIANNGRSPSVGSFRRGVSLRQANLLGLGDGLSVSYTNTDGSDGIDLNYSLPINP
ncbi:MAG: ShlB/FhaC/HecB family hemolysin secretion/activation protein, partial [Symploca sp. SIO1C4]|nr:ShlB/FhaC/HecB family hemolysin secretion/activation protein [Symploca sp. SIO1C4]